MTTTSADRLVGEVPTAALVDSWVVWSQPLLTTALLVTSLLTVRPLATSGTGLYAGVLLAGCVVHAYSRSLPDAWVPPRARLGAAVVGAVGAGLLFGVSSGSWGVGFAYVVTTHVGYRFTVRPALALTALTTAVAAGALALGPHLLPGTWTWLLALTVAPPVLSGLARQNRGRTLADAREVVAQTRRAAASEAEASTLAERNRIARELHDVLAHSLSGVSVQLDSADALLEAGRLDEGRAGVLAARRLAVEGLVQARQAVSALREDAVDVEATLHRQLLTNETLQVRGDLARVPGPPARAVLRIVQESLTNARRHAPGAPTTVDIDVGPVGGGGERLLVVVTNAAPPAPVAPFALGSGLGLVGLHERAAALGGTCEAGPLTRGPGAGGWRVAVDLPLAALTTGTAP